MPKDFVGARLAPTLITAIDKIAEEQTRTRTNAIEFILTDWFKKNRPDLLSPEKKKK
jgi:hypothetical protein